MGGDPGGVMTEVTDIPSQVTPIPQKLHVPVQYKQRTDTHVSHNKSVSQSSMRPCNAPAA